jgi:hypothetical protein
MRQGRQKAGKREGKIKGRGTPSAPNLRFRLSAHGVGSLERGTMEIRPVVPWFFWIGFSLSFLTALSAKFSVGRLENHDQ